MKIIYDLIKESKRTIRPYTNEVKRQGRYLKKSVKEITNGRERKN